MERALGVQRRRERSRAIPQLVERGLAADLKGALQPLLEIMVRNATPASSPAPCRGDRFEQGAFPRGEVESADEGSVSVEWAGTASHVHRMTGKPDGPILGAREEDMPLGPGGSDAFGATVGVQGPNEHDLDDHPSVRRCTPVLPDAARVTSVT